MDHGREFENYAYRSGYLQTSLENAAEDMARAAIAIGPGQATIARHILESAVIRIEQILAQVDTADAAIAERLSMNRPASRGVSPIAARCLVGPPRPIRDAAEVGA